MDETKKNIVNEAEKILKKYEKQQKRREKYIIDSKNRFVLFMCLCLSIILLGCLIYQVL
ncbi:MAG: hypothetical protein ACLFMO_06455 [Eubacteriales bacterium]